VVFGPPSANSNKTMPRYNPSPEEEEMYSSSSEVTSPEEKSESEDAESVETVDEESMQDKSVLVSNKVLMGPDGSPPKEGDEIVVKVVKNYGDESEIVCAPESTGTETETDTSDAEISAMDSKETY